MKIGMLKVLRVAGILSVAANIVLIILKFVLKEDIQNSVLIINMDIIRKINGTRLYVEYWLC